MNTQTLFDSYINSNTKQWYILDDAVMGGRSKGEITRTDEGYARFSGKVSLANNGGFSLVRFAIQKTSVNPESTLKITLKGDGSDFQFRVKNDKNEYYSYTSPFSTKRKWETVEFQLKDLYPTFRGRRLNIPNFNHNSIEEVTFFIGNKVPQKFELLISKIELVL
ncbi:CIA30 family protein [Ulvibacterium sp.]|uniref:CIA30 family protein n=1 Tax=Ulvibacterium sp. TaxID=2665914 RepID=UPI00262DE802|nr:CIA30 family protein [Ulvibacterium sp.]